jgi:ATP-dependent DNA helicase RecG
VRTPADLAATLPRTYRDWRVAKPLAQIVREALERAQDREAADTFEEIAVGELASVHEVRRRLSIINAQLRDGSGTIELTWFGRRGLHFEVGERLFVHGRVALKRKAGRMSVEMNVLHHRVLRPDEVYVGSIVPVYPATKDVSSRAIATIIERNLEALGALVHDVIPAALPAKHGLPERVTAWREVHRPATLESAATARKRLIYDEFFAIALAAAMKRAHRAEEGGAQALPAPGTLLDDFERSLPFKFTAAQRRVIAQIFADMAQTIPMNRLLQGDVGSGKTLVAAAAIVLAARDGVQSALMAPTEILAAQHAAKLAPLLLAHGIPVDAVFGSMAAAQRRSAHDRIASGEALLAVGTHALLTESVTFKNLGLVVIDEQHRFGVAQRARLRAKSRAPHTLSMTATPIPRSLAQTRYAEFDLSIIDEMPPGRTPIETYVLRASRKFQAYEFVRKNVALGRQAYVVAPAIDEGSVTDEGETLTSVVRELELLQTEYFPDLRVALLHGRMPVREKDAIMGRFTRGEIDVLLATTVVEVGVDVPNAAVMVVLDAHRYGLAQLHQLRGRVGRGVERSYCILIAPDDKADVERLEILASTTDGFEIAEADMRLRGFGEFAGTAQAGVAANLLGDIQADFSFYLLAKADADALVQSDPELAQPEHRALRSMLDEDTNARAILVSS